MLPRHHPDRIRIAFDDHRLVANAGLVLPATLALRLGLPELVHNHLDLGRAPGRANTAVATTRRRTARRDLGLHRFARYRMVPDGEDYFEPPSTRPARTAQSTICCLVLNPSFLWTADTAFRTVSPLLFLISPISW